MKLLLVSLTLLACVAAFEVSIRSLGGSTVEYAIRNPTDFDIKVLKWGTPFEGIRADMFVVTDANGKVAEYSGALYKRGAYPIPEEFLDIPAHSSVSNEVDLSLSYNLGKVGEYSVELQIPIYAEVTPSDVAQGTTTIQVDKVTPPPARVEILKDYQNCNSGQANDVRASVNQGKSEAGKGRSCLAGRTCNTQATTWLGVDGSNRWNNVRDMCGRIDSSLNTNTFNCYCYPSGCGSNVYAYVYPSDSSRRVYLCNLFFTRPNERAETIVHEMSHFNTIGGTRDVVYGRAACQNLARTNPSSAVTNADNICYFTDSAP